MEMNLQTDNGQRVWCFNCLLVSPELGFTKWLRAFSSAVNTCAYMQMSTYFFFCHGENLDLQKRKKKCFPTFYRVTRTWESCRIYLLKHWWRIINRVAQWFRGRLWSLMDPSLNIWHLLIVCPWTITHLTVPQFTAQYVCDNNTNLICIRWELSYTRSQNSHNKHLSPYKLFLLNKGWELGN